MTSTEKQPLPSIRDGVQSIQSMVRDDLGQREELGILEYGTTLQAHNGRNALVDAYQEALDLSCYLRQVIEEGGLVGRHGADDTPRDPSTTSTRSQLLARILDGDTERRLGICGHFMDSAEHSQNCLMRDHEGEIERLRKRVRELSATVRSDIQDGKVVSWYLSVYNAERHEAVLSASWRGVAIHVPFLTDVPGEWLEGANRVYTELATNRDADMSSWATHRNSIVSNGPLVPVGGGEDGPR